ncbi:MAG: hypothetical protein FH751_04410 [Firmicutes bacterium]|nr:hypothetical protein [Bacillota bacterium]
MELSYRIYKKSNVDGKKFSIPIKTPTPKQIKNKDNEKEELIDTYDEELENIEVLRKEILNNAKLEAKEIINDANDQKKELLNKAKEEINVLKDKAYKEAYDEGFNKGKTEGFNKAYDEAKVEANALRKEAKDVLKDAHKKSRDYIEGTNKEIIDLIIDVSENVTGLLINESEKNIVEMVKKALQEVREKRQIILRIHPESSLYLESNLHQFNKICPNAKFTILEDKDLEENGCKIESESEIIDLQISEQLENIKSKLLEMSVEDDG